ncbi:MAG: phage tail protein [Crocinitomicaceae bacterium]|nr:phage tail protein [Crocinitomicaceae bacterium]|tara:strand:+ start:4204 stop:6147 length:1944 start_codon:yes stop_codon:yes gene_type:complete
MSAPMKTPGVYIQELDAFGNSVVPVPTAVPAFIGYTGKTSFNGKSLLNKAVKVTSLAEFLLIFGSEPPKVQYSLSSNVLQERLDELTAEADSSATALTNAKDALTKAGGDPTTVKATKTADAEAAVKAAQSASDAKPDDPALKAEVVAQQALLNSLQVADSIAAYNADPNITALNAAQKAVDTANAAAPNSATDAQKKALADAQQTLANLVEDADFCTGGYAYTLTAKTINYRMYSSLKFFYENGGGDCYIMTIGTYDYSKSTIGDTSGFSRAITLLKKETEPTMLLIPDLVEIQDPSQATLEKRYASAYSLQGEMINHCGEMMNRVAVLDIPGGYSEPLVGKTSVDQFRDSVTPTLPKFASYAAAYYPWLHTTVYQTGDISYQNVDPANYGQITQLLTIEFTDPDKGLNANMAKAFAIYAQQGASTDALKQADVIFQNLSKSYKLLMTTIMSKMNLIAPSAGMAGIYTTVDNNEGVWIAPANVAVQSTVAPSINIDHAAQEDLNMPINGKSVCAIRAFTGRGNLVWGARTLDGNSNDWRYINVRRTLIYIEQSVQDASKAYVFAPNDAGTWVNVKSMIGNFLFGLWKQGGLVGPKPADAYSVSVGLGSTMTGDDILNGIMRVAVKVAVSHPAEFIEITFQQQMQKA